MTTALAAEQRQQAGYERYEAYQRWEQQQLADPRFASVRMLVDDLRDHDEILPETWERFDVEERTWAAEVLNAPHSHIDRFRFDGQDIIVKETDGLHPRLTLREVYEKGLEKSRAESVEDPGLAFQQRRDELFLNFYEQIEAMMRGETEHDTIHMISACPRPEEFSCDSKEVKRLFQKCGYSLELDRAFDYTARRLPSGDLELSVTTLDNSNLEAHAKVLQAFGHEQIDSFAMLSSHEYGDYLSFETTVAMPIEVVVASRVAVYDKEMQRQTGKPHRYGREDDTIDAHKFFETYCEEYWAGYRAYNELLALHLSGGDLSPRLRYYLSSCMFKQELDSKEKQVLSQANADRLQIQLMSQKVTADMAKHCRELMIYSHQATLSKLLKQYQETGTVKHLPYKDGEDLLGAYADAASSNSAEAAANGEVFAGCGSATELSNTVTVANAAERAASGNLTLEQALRMHDEEARHCLNIQLLGYTIRKNVTCPFCIKQVNARDTQKTIECMDDGCRKVLDKATGKVSTRKRLSGIPVGEAAKVPRVKLYNNQIYELGEQSYRRELHTVVGGADLVYVDTSGQEYRGPAAEQIEAAILNQLESVSQAA